MRKNTRKAIRRVQNHGLQKLVSQEDVKTLIELEKVFPRNAERVLKFFKAK